MDFHFRNELSQHVQLCDCTVQGKGVMEWMQNGPERAGIEWGSILMTCVRTYVSVTLRNIAVTSRWNVPVSRLRA